MKLRQLKKFLDSLPEEKLNEELFYNSTTHFVSGVVLKVKRQPHDLYYNGDDDPAELYSKSALQKRFDDDEIKSMTIEVPKGTIVLEF